MPITILFQDDYLIAVNKPSGLLVHKSWVAKDA
ncbi:MAG: tRNA pseudouridine65 synthase, partial [Psychrobacter glaciei]